MVHDGSKTKVTKQTALALSTAGNQLQARRLEAKIDRDRSVRRHRGG